MAPFYYGFVCKVPILGSATSFWNENALVNVSEATCTGANVNLVVLFNIFHSTQNQLNDSKTFFEFLEMYFT